MWIVYREETGKEVFRTHSYMDAEDWVSNHSGVAYGIILDWPL